jgi:hypothetical protein
MGGRVESHSRFRENRSHGRKRNEDPGPQAGASHLHGPSSSKTNFISSPSPPLTYATAPMHHPMLLRQSPVKAGRDGTRKQDPIEYPIEYPTEDPFENPFEENPSLSVPNFGTRRSRYTLSSRYNISLEPDNSPAEHGADILQVNPKPLQSVRGTRRTISEDDTMDDAERRKIRWIAIQDSIEPQWLCFKDQRIR